MKDFLKSQLARAQSPLHGRNIVREYLQARILASLQRSGAMVALAFHGGTALRFLYAIPRYSEDLDFALERPTAKYDFRTLLHSIRAELAAEDYGLALKVNDRRTVHSAFVRFPNLFYELKLSPHPDETLSIRIEVDTNPPSGAALETTLVRRHTTLRLQHHDRASLLAGKMHALLQRPYTKGRDIYDLIWYLSDPNWPEPNIELLHNALRQTEWSGELPTIDTWRQILREKIEQLSWPQVIADVEPFLENESERQLLTLENMRLLLQS